MQLTKIASLMAVDKVSVSGSLMATVNRSTRGKGQNVGAIASHEDIIDMKKHTIKAHVRTKMSEHLLNGSSECARTENVSDKTY